MKSMAYVAAIDNRLLLDYRNSHCAQDVDSKGLPTPSESERESEKDQRTIRRDQGTNDKHQENFRFPLV